MYNYDYLLNKLKIDNTLENRKYLKSIIHALIKNNDAMVIKQLIEVDYNKVEYLYNLFNELTLFFDYGYNTKIDLTKFLFYILNDKPLNINAIFCPGYTTRGYKNYIGNNNTRKLETLSELSKKLNQLKVETNFKIMLANIFLENTDDLDNPNWKDELYIHEKKFKEVANKYFIDDEIFMLSDIYSTEEYVKGFVIQKLCNGKVYDNFYKNNLEFYKKMGWDNEQIKYRNDRLFTIYNIVSKYINSVENGIYIPMETMYSRSKVISSNNVCTMYLIKK